ncbi:mechanosensitive ion channel family protein [Patescibacteria group bacterium]|nr:mechanosensitive ion channel family protein [Patescibacteria group bacterium]
MTKIIEFYNTYLFSWLINHGFKIIIILLVAWLINKFSRQIIKRLVTTAVRENKYPNKKEEKQREETLIGLLTSTSRIAVITLTGLMVLSEAGLAIAPLLAAAGIAGLSFGFGGQYLIRDVITGLFLILENQYRVGDVICLGDKCGLVENMSLRITVMRDLDGTVHHVPHGEIKIVSNLSKSYARINLNIAVSYETDLDVAEKIINQVGQDLAKDPIWQDKIITAPAFVRLDDFADSAMIIKVLGDTKPLEQWSVTGEFRKRLKKSFDQAGIIIPFPQMVIRKG